MWVSVQRWIADNTHVFFHIRVLVCSRSVGQCEATVSRPVFCVALCLLQPNSHKNKALQSHVRKFSLQEAVDHAPTFSPLAERDGFYLGDSS